MCSVLPLLLLFLHLLLPLFVLFRVAFGADGVLVTWGQCWFRLLNVVSIALNRSKSAVVLLISFLLLISRTFVIIILLSHRKHRCSHSSSLCCTTRFVSSALKAEASSYPNCRRKGSRSVGDWRWFGWFSLVSRSCKVWEEGEFSPSSSSSLWFTVQLPQVAVLDYVVPSWRGTQWGLGGTLSFLLLLLLVVMLEFAVARNLRQCWLHPQEADAPSRASW